MKILIREKISPIALAVGDKIQTRIRWRNGKEQIIAEYETKEAMTIDESVIFSMDDIDLEELGWESGVGGAFGKRKS